MSGLLQLLCSAFRAWAFGIPAFGIPGHSRFIEGVLIKRGLIRISHSDMADYNIREATKMMMAKPAVSQATSFI